MMVCILTLLVTLCTAHNALGNDMTQKFSPGVLNAANFAMDSLNRMSNYPYAFKVVDISSDTAQLYPPAHVKYILEVQAAQTTCRNQANVNLADCPVQTNAATMTCSFVVFAVPGNNTIPKRLLSHQCV